MLIEKRVKLKSNFYYVVVDVEYKIDKNGITMLYFRSGKTYDGGNFTKLIGRCEKVYTYRKAREYDAEIGLMADILFLYDRIPFLIGIKDVYISDEDSLPYIAGYISREEIEIYIKDYKVNMNRNNRFDLSNEETWII